MLLRQFVIWTKWKSKIRWRQVWSNFKIFNVEDGMNVWLVLAMGRVLGIVFMFVLGFAISYTCKKLAISQIVPWGITLLFPLIDGLSDGRSFATFISSAQEERWLLVSTHLTGRQYFTFLWLDQYLWNHSNRFFASISLVVGVYSLFPIRLWTLVLAWCMALLFGAILSFLSATSLYHRIQTGKVHSSIRMLGRVVVTALCCYFFWYMAQPIYNYIQLAIRVGLSHAVQPWATSLANHLSNDQFLWFLPVALVHLAIHGPSTGAIVDIVTYFLIAMILVIVQLWMLKMSAEPLEKQSLIGTRFLQSMLDIIGSLDRRLRNPVYRWYMAAINSSPVLSLYVTSNIYSWIWVVIVFYIGSFHLLYNQFSYSTTFLIEQTILLFITSFVLQDSQKYLQRILAFDADARQTQYYILHGKEPDDIYDLKKHWLLLFVLPRYLLSILICTVFTDFSLTDKIMLFLTTSFLFLIQVEFLLLPTLLAPHFERSGIAGTIQFPDQQILSRAVRHVLNTPLSLSLLLLMTAWRDHKSVSTWFVESLMIVVGILVYYGLRSMSRKRWSEFSVEEIVLSREARVALKFWGQQTNFIFGVAGFALLALLSIAVRQYVLGVAAFFLFRVAMNVFVLNTYQRSASL